MHRYFVFGYFTFNEKQNIIDSCSVFVAIRMRNTSPESNEFQSLELNQLLFLALKIEDMTNLMLSEYV